MPNHSIELLAIYARIDLYTPPVQYVTMAYFIKIFKDLCYSNSFVFFTTFAKTK
jgi:hypothetical protein